MMSSDDKKLWSAARIIVEIEQRKGRELTDKEVDSVYENVGKLRIFAREMGSGEERGVALFNIQGVEGEAGELYGCNTATAFCGFRLP